MLQRTVTETIERGILAGTGSNGQPMGLLNDPQLNQETFTAASGSLPTAAKTAELVAEILQAGGDLESVQILLSAEDYADSQQPSTASDTPLVSINDSRRRMAGVPVAFSPYVPTGNVILADWSRVAISYVGAPQLIINPYTYSESGMLELTLFQMVSYAVERRELLTVAKLTA
jgi:HK97 family phage major capsid protein